VVYELVKAPGALKIGPIYGSFLGGEWIDQHGSEGEQKVYHWFVDTLKTADRAVEELTPGQEMEIDGVQIEVLGAKNPEILPNGVNNSSIIVRISDSEKSVLFTGDLGVEGGDKALKGPFSDRIHADYIQMAHHGQAGVSEAFYEHVGARYCLWPTPLWLWDNDNGGGKGSGPWKTLTVREWMEKLPIEHHYVMTEGLHEIK
jgi:hypothetical protein